MYAGSRYRGERGSPSHRPLSAETLRKANKVQREKHLRFLQPATFKQQTAMTRTTNNIGMIVVHIQGPLERSKYSK